MNSFGSSRISFNTVEGYHLTFRWIIYDEQTDRYLSCNGMKFFLKENSHLCWLWKSGGGGQVITWGPKIWRGEWLGQGQKSGGGAYTPLLPPPPFRYPWECSFGKELHPLWMTSTFHYVLTSSCNGQELSINTISSGTKASEVSIKNNSTTNNLNKETLF